MTPATRPQQLAALSRGLALGAIINGIAEVNGQKPDLELAFRRAWRRWDHASLLPGINAGPSRDDVIIHALEQSERRRGPLIAAWKGRYPFRPYLEVAGWSFTEAAESVHEDIPAAGWADLVADWVGPDGRALPAPAAV